jgi:ectoine hydroxylase-related dioxygenase (phytanoyl-CoA dioxygenase family)
MTCITASDEQRKRWDEDGFLVIERFVDDELLAELRAAYDEVLAGDVEAHGDRMLGGITRQVMFPSIAHPLFNRNEAVRRGIHLARQLLGTEDTSRSFDMLIYKPPGHPHDTPWHQDMAYSKSPFAPAGSAIPLESIQFWVGLDDADAENGCMHFVPGAHKRPLLAHHVAAGDPDDDGRLLAVVDPEAVIDPTEVMVAAVPAGGCTLHSYGTLHYTPPNRSSDRPRRAYIFNVATAAATRRLAGLDG